MTADIVAWVDQKATVVDALAQGHCGGSYADACLVVSAVISGLASALWPGAGGVDRRRFVQLWATYAPVEMEANLVSLPLLIDRLEEQSRFAEAEKLRAANPLAFGPGYVTRVVTSADVDLPEQAVLRQCSSLTQQELRSQTYASVFYRQVRSSYVHECQISQHANELPMARAGAGVSYVNVVQRPHRRIHFEPSWLVQLLRALVRKLEPPFAAAPHSRPSTWWLDGAKPSYMHFPQEERD